MSYLEFEWNGKVLKIDKMLAETLASLVYNVKDDYDFCVVVTGNRMVRTGKSVITMTCCAFCAYLLKKMNLNENAYDEEHIFFDSKRMLDKAQGFKKYSVIHLDEARESLAASKTAMQSQAAVLDFFAECGALNHIFFLVMPDYFEMKEVMSVSRSEILINVYRDSAVVHKDFMGDGIKRPITMFKRGFFKLYNRDSKALMYDLFRTTRNKNYNSVRPTFPAGSFENQYCIDEKKYRDMKMEALSRFKENHEKKLDKMSIKYREELVLTYQMLKEAGVTSTHIAEVTGKSVPAVSIFLKKHTVLDKKDTVLDKKEATGYVKVH